MNIPLVPFTLVFRHDVPQATCCDAGTQWLPTQISLEIYKLTHSQKAIRDFLKVRTSYDVLPLSFRLIILNTSLLVKKSLTILLQNGIVSAPLWDSSTSTFAGLLTTSDYINVIQYYWQNPDALTQIDQFRLSSLRDVEKAIGVEPIETLSVHPMKIGRASCRERVF